MMRLNDLKAIISTLIIKNEIEFKTSLMDIQSLVLHNYNLEYSQDEIENCLLELWYQDDIDEYEERQHSEIPNFIYL